MNKKLDSSHLPDDTTTDFGFQHVSPAMKTEWVQDVFTRVAGRYDLMNDLMSAGMHRLWKRWMVQTIRPYPNAHILDVAGGTGDISLLLRSYWQQSGLSAGITVCDPNYAMINYGRDRALDRGAINNLDWICGTAEAIPLADASIDIYTIAFGLRNVTNRGAALKEALRVLRPGGRFYCLEFSHVQNSLLERVYQTYSFEILPRLGQWIAGDRAAYQYLVESIALFPTADKLRAELAHVGFAKVHHRFYSGGIVALHQGEKT